MHINCSHLTQNADLGYFQKGTLFLQMQKGLLTEGFKKEAEALNKEIAQLKEDIQATENSFNISDVLDMASVALIAVLPGAYKVAGMGLKLLSDRMKAAEKP